MGIIDSKWQNLYFQVHQTFIPERRRNYNYNYGDVYDKKIDGNNNIIIIKQNEINIIKIKKKKFKFPHFPSCFILIMQANFLPLTLKLQFQPFFY